MSIFMNTNQFGITLTVNRSENKQSQTQSSMMIPLRIDAAAVHSMITLSVGKEESKAN